MEDIQIQMNLALEIYSELDSLLEATDAMGTGLLDTVTDLDARIMEFKLLHRNQVLLSKRLAERVLHELKLISQMDNHPVLCTCGIYDKIDALEMALGQSSV